eukprot:scaffold48758_cov61-Phaeocystis_antarctica.AAC.1
MLLEARDTKWRGAPTTVIVAGGRAGGHAPGAWVGPLQLRPVQARPDRRHPGPCPRAPRHRIERSLHTGYTSLAWRVAPRHQGQLLLPRLLRHRHDVAPRAALGARRRAERRHPGDAAAGQAAERRLLPER